MRKWLILLLLPLTLYAKVYDCFMFDQELEVLEIRLHEMGPYVDHFVLVEWNRTHRTGELKPYHFDLNKEKFQEFLPKIIHIKLDEVIETEDGWVRENWHRNQIMRGLTNCDAEDLIIISDVDEIISGFVIKDIYKLSENLPVIGFWQEMFRGFLNRYSPEPWTGTAVVRYKYLEKIFQNCPQLVRNIMIRERARRPHNQGEESILFQHGWHFSSMGGYERAKYKHNNIVEGNESYPAYEEWYEGIQKTSELVEIDESFPKWVSENIDYLTDVGLIDTHWSK